MTAKPRGTMGDELKMVEYRDGASVLLVADSEAGFERTSWAAGLAGCRIIDTVMVSAGAGRLDLQVAADAVLVDLQADSGAALTGLLDRLEEAAGAGRYGSVVSAPPALIDIVAARAVHRDIHHLCEPMEMEWVMATTLACARPGARLHDINKQAAPPRLQQLSEEIGRIATVLAALSEEEAAASDGAAGLDLSAGPGVDAGHIRAIIRARRLRDHYFKGGLFADPAWDMLLDLMAARLDEDRVAVSSLCIAAAVPPTTALRWIKMLSDQGLFVRIADEQDGRRVFIELSDQAAAGLDAYLRAAQRISPVTL